MSPGLNFTKLY